MSDTIEVRVRQRRYNSTVPMITADVVAFIGVMESYAENHLGIDRVLVSTPADGTSILFQFEVESE